MEPVIEEQLSKRRRRQRRVLIFDEQTQLPFAEMADQIQNYNDTLRVLVSKPSVIPSCWCLFF